jgi:hypothetical protein
MQLRRERIAERIRALQDLVPNTNKVTIHDVFLNVIMCSKEVLVSHACH